MNLFILVYEDAINFEFVGAFTNRDKAIDHLRDLAVDYGERLAWALSDEGVLDALVKVGVKASIHEVELNGASVFLWARDKADGHITTPVGGLH